MKKLFALTVIFTFFSTFYLMPALEAITLGDIKSGPNEKVKQTESGKKPGAEDLKQKVKIPEKKELPGSAEEVEKKKSVNPRLVCLLSVVMPGGGQFYLNNDTKGLAFCLAAGVGYTATGYFLIKTTLAESGTTEYKNYLLVTGFLFFVTMIVHFVGIIEAYSDAEDFNRKNLFGDRNDDNPFIAEIIIE